MNEDQLAGAAEREMDLYRDEITRVQAELENQVARGDRLEGRNEDLRNHIRVVAEGLERRAEINRPSKVTEICDGIAASLRGAIGG
jgi:hypothetical protein